MKPTELKSIGQRIFGKRWQTKMARKLGVDPSTVRRWASGQVTVPGPVSVALKLLDKPGD